MKNKTNEERSKRIIEELKLKYPGKDVFDLDGNGNHFVCEVDPTSLHDDYDMAVEVIISSKSHKHIKATQYYTILSGTLCLYVGDEKILLKKGDKYIIMPGTIHSATSEDECWVEIVSKPGWRKEDHISV